MVRFTQPEGDDNEGFDHSNPDDEDSDHSDLDNTQIIVSDYVHTSDRLVSRSEGEEALGQLEKYYADPHSRVLHCVGSDQRARIPYIRISLLLALFFTFCKYVPPPPTPHHLWSDFVTKSTEDITTALKSFTVLVWYIASGLSFNIYQDITYWTHHILIRGTDVTKHPCNISLPRQEEGEGSIIENYLLETIVGQDAAIQFIAKILEGWRIPEYRFSNNSQHKPLSILISGLDGVGKTLTAKLIARLLFQNCSESKSLDCNKCGEEINRGILDINAVDFALDENKDVKGSEELRTNPLTSKILEHIYSMNGGGAVIILNHVEDLPQNTLVELSLLLEKSSVSFRPLTQRINLHSSRWISKEMASMPSTEDDDIEVWLGNTLFLFTTEGGVERVFELARKYSKSFEELPWYELQDVVKEDMRNSLERPITTNSHIVPFWPLQAADLDLILERKITNLFRRYKGTMWKHLELLDFTRQNLISPDVVDYIKYGSTIVFARKGASYLDDHIKMIEKSLNNLPLTNYEDVILIDYHKDRIRVRICDEDRKCTPSNYEL